MEGMKGCCKGEQESSEVRGTAKMLSRYVKNIFIVSGKFLEIEIYIRLSINNQK